MTTPRPAARLDGLGVTLIRRILAEAPDNALHLGLGMTDIEVPEAFRRAVVHSDALRRAAYGPNAGDPALRAILAERAGVDAARVVVTSGVQEGIALATLGLVDPGREVLVPDPGFPVYGSLARVAGGVAVPYRPRPENRFRPTWADIEPLLSERTALVILCSPGNPTGAVAEPAEWRRIGTELAAREVAVVSDEIYLDLQHGEHIHGSLLRQHPDAIILGGPAKTHGLAGWRLGWMVLPDTLVDPIVALHQHLVTSASTLVQEAARAIAEPASDAEVEALRRRLVDRRARAVDGLRGTRWEVAAGDGAFYLWIRRDDQADDLALCRALMRETGVVTIPGRAFGDAGRGYLRLSYSVDDTTLDQALDRMASFQARP